MRCAWFSYHFQKKIYICNIYWQQNYTISNEAKEKQFGKEDHIITIVRFMGLHIHQFVSNIFDRVLNSYTQITQCAYTDQCVDNKSWNKFTCIQLMKLNLKGNQFAKGGHIKSVILINGLIIISSSPTVQWLSGLCMMLDNGRMMAKCLILCSPNSYPNPNYRFFINVLKP